MSDLGLLGNVEHNASTERHLTTSQIGREYRLVWSTVVNGECFEEPFDGQAFSAIADARVALCAARAAIAKAAGK